MGYAKNLLFVVEWNATQSWPCCGKARTCNCQAQTARKAIKSGWMDDWSELMKSGELHTWMIVKLMESYCQARKEDNQRKSIVQQRTQKSTEFLM